MPEWPKTFGVDSDGETVVFGPDGQTKIPAGEPMIRLDLGRQLYEALNYQIGAGLPTDQRVRRALACYEREVGDASPSEITPDH